MDEMFGIPDLSQYAALLDPPEPVGAMIDPSIEDQRKIVGSLSASTAFKAIKKYVQSFEASLDAKHETGAMLTSFGQSVLMNVSCIRCEEPNVFVFEGIVNGKAATLIQHMSQLNFLLISMPREDPAKPKMPIGFAG